MQLRASRASVPASVGLSAARMCAVTENAPSSSPTAMTTPPEVLALIARFAEHESRYASPSYKEAELRQEFVDPLLGALGWDVGNKKGLAESFKEVVVEFPHKDGDAARAPDYALRIGGQTQLFVEAKKPSVNLKENPEPAFQLRRYGWTKRLVLSVLTDFQELAVYDTRVRPSDRDHPRTARVHYFTYREFDARWNEIASLLSQDAIQHGSIERFSEGKGARKGTAEVDDSFLEDIESWRDLLARDLHRGNPKLSVRALNSAVQQTIDRIVFLRISEDRGIEPLGRLRDAASKKGIYRELIDVFKSADARYNSGLFHFRSEKGRATPSDTVTPDLVVSDAVLVEIIGGLYPPRSPYAFSVLPADILGQVYERFLGKSIVFRGNQVRIDDKPAVRKAGGVYYTPTFVVRHIVDAAVVSQLNGKSLRQVSGFRVLDPACGSGSFLLGAFEALLSWYREAYVADNATKWSGGRTPRLYATMGHEWRLTVKERKRILVDHIFGVDIDAEAVEVTKLSLLLKVLEGETPEQLDLIHDRALPDLDENIKCGNSLIESDFVKKMQADLFSEEHLLQTNAFDWNAEFPTAFADNGFDAVLGNPPYILLQDEFRDDAQLAYFRSRFKVAAFKIDTYHLFMERGLSLTKKGGVLSMITPSNFLTNNHLVELRRLILKETTVRELLVIEKGVFKGASVDNAIFALEGHQASSKVFRVQRVRPDGGGFAQVSVQEVSPKHALADDHVLLIGGGDKPLRDLWKRLATSSVALSSIADVNFGKQLRDRKKFQKDVIDVKSLKAVPRTHRACYTGRDVTPYRVEWGGLACLDSTVAQRGGCWDAAKQNAKNKLVTRQIGRTPAFGLDGAGYQCLNTMFMVNIQNSTYDPYFLLGVLNSPLMRVLWLDRFYDQRHTFPKIKGTYLKLLPVPNLQAASTARAEAARRVVELTKELVRLHEASGDRSSGDQTRLSRQSNALAGAVDDELQALYGLTASDWKVVQGAVQVANFDW
jgi:hypothetical protein